MEKAYLHFTVRDIQAPRGTVQVHTVSWWQNWVQYDEGGREGLGQFSESRTGWVSPRDLRNLALFALL